MGRKKKKTKTPQKQRTHPNVIWIAGIPGVGKTTMMKRLKETCQKENSNADYYDLDDIVQEVRQHLRQQSPRWWHDLLHEKPQAKIFLTEQIYERLVDLSVESTSKGKRIVFVGMTSDVHFAGHKLYIQDDLPAIYRRRLLRELQTIEQMAPQFREWITNAHTEDELRAVDYDISQIVHGCFAFEYDAARQQKQRLEEKYKQMKFRFLPHDTVFKIVCGLINKQN
jgi:adenylate kinase family enzyme